MPFKNKKDKFRHQKKYYRKIKSELMVEGNKVFGKTCFFCGGKVHVLLHRKDGVQHKRYSITVQIALKNPNEWVKLCYPCHKVVHWMMKHFKMTWEEIESRVVQSGRTVE